MLPGQQLPADAGNAAGPAGTGDGPNTPSPAANPSPDGVTQGAGKDEDFGDLEPWLGPLREKHPPLTPLDEA